jgi:ribosome-associated protein
MKNNKIDDEDIEYISKSEQKRWAEELQAIGVELIDLPENLFSQLELPASLEKAITDTRKIQNFSARRRQYQLIGKIMRKIDDVEPIKKALAQWKEGNKIQNQKHTRYEKHREQLLNGDQSVLHIYLEKQACDEKKLSELINQAKNEVEQNNKGKAFKSLFKYLREIDN